MTKSGLCSACVFLAVVLVKMGVACNPLWINHPYTAFLVLSKSAVKSMNDHNLSIFGSISMKFSL